MSSEKAQECKNASSDAKSSPVPAKVVRKADRFEVDLRPGVSDLQYGLYCVLETPQNLDVRRLLLCLQPC